MPYDDSLRWRKVSIHAPVRVRLVQLNSPLSRKGFNSRTREGATDYLGFNTSAPIVSIHAPVRVRPTWDGLVIFADSFNSRTREGATLHYVRY